jgi:hypothetical protein
MGKAITRLGLGLSCGVAWDGRGKQYSLLVTGRRCGHTLTTLQFGAARSPERRLSPFWKGQYALSR